MEEIITAKNGYYVNRNDRRSIENEFKRNIVPFRKIEVMFISDILNSEFEDSTIEYDEIYNEYLERWMECIKIHNLNKKFVHTVLNEHYFENAYKPVESNKSNQLGISLFTKIREHSLKWD